MTSPQDLERLSAYLDNQLSPKEKARLEARLAHETELGAALADLRQTVRALRSLPVVKPPRNFTLSPQQASVKVPSRPAFGALRLATAFAAMALVLVFAGDLAASLSPAFSPAAQAPAPRVVSRSVAQATSLPPSVPMAAAPIITAVPTEAAAEQATVAQNAGPTTEDMAHLGGAGGPPTTEVMSQGALAPAVGPSAAGGTPESGFAAAGPAQPGARGTMSTPTGTSQPAAMLALAPPATTTGVAQANEVAATAPATETEAPALASPTTAESQTSPATEGIMSLTSTAPVVEATLAAPPLEPTTPPAALPWRPLEIGLAMLTAILAIATWLARRA